MTEAPAPLTPPNCNLRTFRDMPFDIGRFQRSDLVVYEDPDAIVAAITLWCAAWHEVPAASVPNDDKWLAKHAGYGRAVDNWLAVREGALRGFVLCSDGRLYNKTLAEKANESWDRHLRWTWERAKDRHRKAQKNLPEASRTEFPEFEAWLSTDGALISAGTDDEFQRNGTPVPPENALKGKERKGKESILPNLASLDSKSLDAKSETGADAEASGTDDDSPVQEVRSPTAGKDRFDAACAACGMNPTQPGHIAKAHDQLRQWEEAGIDFDAVVIPTIRAVTAESPDPTYSLLRFDKKIRHEHARSGAKARAGKPYVAPASPILEPDGEGEQFRPLRAALLKAFGPQEFTRFVNPVTFSVVDDRKVVQVNETKRGTLRLMDDGRDTKVRAIAAKLGWEGVW